MKIDWSTLSFNINVEKQGATPSWGTALGQGTGHKISDGLQDFLTAMLYRSVPDIDAVNCPLGKGGNKRDEYDFVVASIFDKVFVNEEQIDNARMLLLVIRERSGIHKGRMSLKYTPKMTYQGEEINAKCYNLIAKHLGLDPNKGSWFVDRLETRNQDELHLFAFVGGAEPITFRDTEERKKYYIEKSGELARTGLRINGAIGQAPEIPLQVIYYGAPGTGKSYKIKMLKKGKSLIRTTFHPDSDYSTFVGAYKPSVTKTKEEIHNKAYLINELKKMKKLGINYLPQIFGIKFWYSLKKLNTSDKKDILTECSLSQQYMTEFNKCIAIGEAFSTRKKDAQIIYEFVPQAFLKAYVKAWAHYPEPQYLVIEEINRGNCAQLFGDLFQLLDRSAEGFSEYPIAADSDISKYLRETFAHEGNFAPDESAQAEINELYQAEYEDVMSGVKSGQLLLLPKNLHILATMNTSDQSLFPIDSAFKRRWEWEYIPIRDAGKGWVITTDGKEWNWWTFLQCINAKIGSVTDSEDKKLGYFFVKPQDDHTITAETFVSKVIFYLWNDVFKDYGFSDKEFQTAEGTEMTFPMFYETDVEEQHVNERLVAQFLQNVVGGSLQSNLEEQATEETQEA